jgi:hypothetical protein
MHSIASLFPARDPAAAAAAAASSPPPPSPPRRDSNFHRLIEVFGNTRRRFNLSNWRRPGVPVQPWPKELLAATSTDLRLQVDRLFQTTWPFNDPTASLDFESHKYQHTKEEWHKLIDIALSRLFTHDPTKQVGQRHLACWLSCAARKGKDDNYPHIRIGTHQVRIGKYLRFLYASPAERQLIWDNVGDNSIHCSHLCHNVQCINPFHMIIETDRENQRRNSCLFKWKKTLNYHKWTLHGLKDPRCFPVCPASHQPKCIFTEWHSGFLIPQANLRRISAAAAAADPDPDRMEIDEEEDMDQSPSSTPTSTDLSAVGLNRDVLTYYEPDETQHSILGVVANWNTFPPSSWEKTTASNWEGAKWRVAHGNFRIRMRRSLGNNRDHPIIVE